MGKKKRMKKENVIKTMEGTEYLKIAKDFGWYVDRKVGSHFHLKHDTLEGLLTIKPSKLYGRPIMADNYKVLTQGQPNRNH
jgi:predicted RNA binding protein YcfA (HicA-like mRNA interferase family)